MGYSARNAVDLDQERKKIHSSQWRLNPETGHTGPGLENNFQVIF
jgi:hypothetical protein